MSYLNNVGKVFVLERFLEDFYLEYSYMYFFVALGNNQNISRLNKMTQYGLKTSPFELKSSINSLGSPTEQRSPWRTDNKTSHSSPTAAISYSLCISTIILPHKRWEPQEHQTPLCITACMESSPVYSEVKTRPGSQ